MKRKSYDIDITIIINIVRELALDLPGRSKEDGQGAV